MSITATLALVWLWATAKEAVSGESRTLNAKNKEIHLMFIFAPLLFVAE
jgi:hypothetical protein